MFKSQNITKEKIALSLQSKFGFSTSICEDIVNNIFSEIISSALKNGKLVIPKFGKFQVQAKPTRPGMNLQTGVPLKIPARKVLKFNASKILKDKINNLL